MVARHLRQIVLAVLLVACVPLVRAHAAQRPFTLVEALGYPFVSDLVSAPDGGAVAWVVNERGVRNVVVADPPRFTPRRVTAFGADNGQQITSLTFSPDGKYLLFVRGGDHFADWEVTKPVDPTSNPVAPNVVIWVVDLTNGSVRQLTVGDHPAVSVKDEAVFVKNHAVWTVPLTERRKPRPLFYDLGHDSDLEWSPDGKSLAFVSNRGDHAFVGVFTSQSDPLTWIAPSTHNDGSPQWSPNGKEIAFIRQPGHGGKPRPLLRQTPRPWSIWVANPDTGVAHVVWRSPDTLLGSFPTTNGAANLHWAFNHRLVFLADLDGWPHLYSIASDGGKPLLLTPGNFMVTDVHESPNRRWLVYNANAGSTLNDSERRHLYRVPVGAATPTSVTRGNGIEWSPTITSDGEHIAYIGAGAKKPPLVRVASAWGKAAHAINARSIPADFPTKQFVVPREVTFKAPDGWTIHGQLFQRAETIHGKVPGIVYVHGGPARQALLGWHPMAYYSNAYAVNQYLADHGFVVLSVNYRLGVGYGHAFHNPSHAGPRGASEYQDVLAGAHFLQQVRGVDGSRIGIWGGSYGGFLTALALARNSDIFKAGVDFSGIHNWTLDTDDELAPRPRQYQKGDWKQAMKVAWESSPDSAVGDWTSPVLLVQGDDDHEVRFLQIVDLARRLSAHHVSFQELVLPDEIHGFLRYHSWLRADTAAVKFFRNKLN